MREVFWNVGWPQIITIAVAVVGGIASAFLAYSFLHDDLRTTDGQRMSRREIWRHVVGLLAFFVLGMFLAGGGCAACFAIVGLG